jgi:hypothetical protein
VDRRRGAREVENFVHLDVERKGDVVAHQLEARIRHQVRDVALRAGVEVVHTEHVVPHADESIAKMRAEESGSPRDEHSCDARISHVGFQELAVKVARRAALIFRARLYVGSLEIKPLATFS